MALERDASDETGQKRMDDAMQLFPPKGRAGSSGPVHDKVIQKGHSQFGAQRMRNSKNHVACMSARPLRPFSRHIEEWLPASSPLGTDPIRLHTSVGRGMRKDS